MHKHLFPIIDTMLDKAVSESEEEGKSVSCRKGCDHCCHLLVEVSWEEAMILAEWVESRPEDEKIDFQKKIRKAAEEAKSVFQKRNSTRKYTEPVYEDFDIPDIVFDEYFYDKKRPCPFLSLEEGKCLAYTIRPTPCRLHMVSSDPSLCSREIEDEENYDVPDEIEQVQEDVGPILAALEKDGRSGQMAIMVEAALRKVQSQKRQEDTQNQKPPLVAVG